MRSVVVLLVLSALGLAAAVPLCAQPRQRPIRVGNRNVLFVGGGYTAHDHPTFDESGFVNLGYMHRILRRELRRIPVWVRGSVNFTSQDIDLDDAFTVQDAAALASGVVALREQVQERTSDFGVRAEMLADLVATRTAALYAGGGFTVHVVSFRSRGLTTPYGIDTKESLIGPSAVVGGRLFFAKRPYTAYGELRYGRTYGRLEAPADPGYLTDQTFDFDGVNAVSFEAGLGLHW